MWQYKCQFTGTVPVRQPTSAAAPVYHPHITPYTAQIPSSINIGGPNALSTIDEATGFPLHPSEGESEGALDANGGSDEDPEGDPEGAPEGAPEAAPEGEEADEETQTNWEDGNQPSPTRRSRYGRKLGRTTPRYIDEYMATIMAYEAITEPMENDAWLDDPLEAYAASADPDVMYLHEVLKQPDRKEFNEAMEKEITDYVRKEFWSLFPKAQVPEGRE
jgi:hypothetical protein